MSELCLTLSYLLDPNMILSILHSIAILAVDSLKQPPTLTSVRRNKRRLLCYFCSVI